MIRRPPRSTLDRSSAASDVYKRQGVISSTTVAGMGKTELYYKELFEKDDHLDVLDTHDLSLIHISEPTRPY